MAIGTPPEAPVEAPEITTRSVHPKYSPRWWVLLPAAFPGVPGVMIAGVKAKVRREHFRPNTWAWAWGIALVPWAPLIALVIVVNVALSGSTTSTHQPAANVPTATQSLPTAAVPTAPPAGAQLPAPIASRVTGVVSGYPADPQQVLLALAVDLAGYYQTKDVQFLREYYLYPDRPGVMDGDIRALANGQTMVAFLIGKDIDPNNPGFSLPTITWDSGYQFQADFIADPLSMSGDTALEERVAIVAYDPSQGRWGIVSSQTVRSFVPWPSN